MSHRGLRGTFAESVHEVVVVVDIDKCAEVGSGLVEVLDDIVGEVLHVVVHVTFDVERPIGVRRSRP